MNKVIFTEPAYYDLIHIENYIRTILNNPSSAVKYVDGIILVEVSI